MIPFDVVALDCLPFRQPRRAEIGTPYRNVGCDIVEQGLTANQPQIAGQVNSVMLTSDDERPRRTLHGIPHP
jgi:hypothetical protein